MRKKRAVKEGSPFEEEYLIELLKEEIKISAEEKDSVKVIMQALLQFGLIELYLELHTLVNNLMKAEFEVKNLFSVE